VAVDPTERAIVIAIRGCTALPDLLQLAHLAPATASFDFTPALPGGVAHPGLLAGAKSILQEHKSLLASLLSQHHGFKVVVVGHSVGGAIAILLASLLSAEGVAGGADQATIETWAFGSPPVYAPLAGGQSYDLPCNSSTTCVLNGADPTPRLFPASLWALLLRLRALDAMPWSSGTRSRIARGLQEMPAGDTQRAHAMYQELVALVPTKQILCLPGRCLQIEHGGDHAPLAMHFSSTNACKELLLSPDLLDDMLPRTYERRLQQYVEAGEAAILK